MVPGPTTQRPWISSSAFLIVIFASGESNRTALTLTTLESVDLARHEVNVYGHPAVVLTHFLHVVGRGECVRLLPALLEQILLHRVDAALQLLQVDVRATQVMAQLV